MSDTYGAVHQRLYAQRGSATVHMCVATGCDKPADVWAWQRTGPNTRGPLNNPKTGYWGTNIADYAPMCRSHAAMLDCGGTLTHCPNGHERAVYGVGTQHNCRQCVRDNARRQYLSKESK